MSTTRRKRKKKITLIRLIFVSAYLFVVGYSVFHYAENMIEISSKSQQLQMVQHRIETQDAQNEELNRLLSGDQQEIIERVARDKYGYAMPNERVFIDMGGK